MTGNFSPHYHRRQGSNRQTVRGPYTHIQVVPKVESAVAKENVPPQVTFRKPSYSEEAASRMIGVLPPTASLANMTLGTTFAAKARAAELNAVRNHRAKAKELEEENDDDTSMVSSTSMGALKLTKPRTRSKGWKPLNLDEIPETSSEADHPEPHYSNNRTPSSSHLDFEPSMRSAQPIPPVGYASSQRRQAGVGTPAQNMPYYFTEAQPVTAIPRYTNEMAAHNAYTSPEHFRQQMQQMNQMALQPNAQYRNFPPPAFTTSFQIPRRRSPESFVQQAKVPGDDPFVDMSAGLRQSSHRQDSQINRRVEPTAAPSNSTPPPLQDRKDHEFQFPTHQQQRVNLPHPPGLPRPTAHAQALHDTFKAVTEASLAPTADTHQRDPKPYTSFAKSSEENSNKQKQAQQLQQAVDASKAHVSLPSSTRTVLYDPVAQHAAGSSRPHEPRVSQSGNEFLQSSEPLPWKDRPVDIYTMMPPTPMVSQFNVRERAAPAAADPAEMDGNAYIRSLISNRESAEDRLQHSEAWWNRDGRGQEQVRAYLERVATEHKNRQSGRQYEDFKKALERQASFRDDRSDDSDVTTVPQPFTEGEIINRLMVPVIANLRGYAQDSGPSYFNKFSKAPAWAVDGGVDGNKSFFGEDWGKPPSRVGRDPRYRPTFHEGRYTVFEPTDGRVSGRGGW
ncbi:MAG: hypothetical protein L6R39_000016 [Caloplaca ligustica]|nr:MAG: hypothetical protein L6R39_000016 [Caloplaca ligustica]